MAGPTILLARVRTGRRAIGDSGPVAAGLPAVARGGRGPGLDRGALADPYADLRPCLHAGPATFSVLRPVSGRCRAAERDDVPRPCRRPARPDRRRVPVRPGRVGT